MLTRKYSNDISIHISVMDTDQDIDMSGGDQESAPLPLKKVVAPKANNAHRGKEGASVDTLPAGEATGVATSPGR